MIIELLNHVVFLCCTASYSIPNTMPRIYQARQCEIQKAYINGSIKIYNMEINLENNAFVKSELVQLKLFRKFLEIIRPLKRN